MNLKLAYCAGHYINTPGKRVPAYLDKNETREWILNDRVADFFAEAAKEYDVELLRTDDPAGKTFIDIPQRTAKANAWGADLYLDIHHNAGIKGGYGGGVEAFSYPGSAKGKQYRNAIYEAVIASGGLKGNRSNPLQEKALDSLRLASAPAVLVEYGFMDSRTDYPIISTESYAKAVAYATMEAIAKVAGLKKIITISPADYDSQEQFVRDVQKAIGAEVDGIPGPETLGKTPTISATKNRTHPVVETVQKRLYAIGYRQVGKADGITGPKFDQAVKAFQKDNDCVDDGELTGGNKTWRCILGME